MTSTTEYDYLRDLIQIPIEEQVLKYETVPAEFIRRLNNCYEKIVPENRDNLILIGDDIKWRNEFLQGLINKIENIEDSIFNTSEEPLKYCGLNGDQSYDLKRSGTTPEKFAYHIFRIIQKLKNLFNSSKISPKIDQSSIQKQTPSSGTKVTKTNISTGYQIKNRYNLDPVWQLLKKNEFIDASVNYNNFERAFTRKRITNKILWKKSDESLHFFIDGFYGSHGNYGIGVEIEDGGQWKKAAECFIKKSGISYNPRFLSRKKKPSKKDEKMLIPIIAQMNKPSKKGLT